MGMQEAEEITTRAGPRQHVVGLERCLREGQPGHFSKLVKNLMSGFMDDRLFKIEK